MTATRFLATAQQRGGDINWNDRYIATTTAGQEYAGIFAGAGGSNFLLGAGNRIYVGDLADLPDHGAGLSPGVRVIFRAIGPTKETRHAKDTAAGRCWAGVARKGQGGQTAAPDVTAEQNAAKTRGSGRRLK